MADVEAQIHSLPEHQPASTTANVARLPPTHGASPPLASTTANSRTINPTSQANNRPHANVPPSQIAANQAKQYGDSSDAVWSMYLTEAEKQDKDEVESWKGDTDGILVFTGLFSATVATFIIESYQNLSPNPSDTTNVLLSQITQQLVNISTGSPLTIVVAQDNRPFKPTASTVRVNVLWFCSLVLSLTCALSATLMQQWARRYQELAQSHGAPHRRGRIRAYIFDGIRKFGMTRAVATMPLLLHISVFLFFVGLVEFLFPTNTTVSYSTLALVVAFVLAYAMITIFPNLYLNCPYATPLSGVTWRLSQFFVIVGLKVAVGIEVVFHNPILKVWSRFNRHVAEPPSIESWMKALKDKVELHGHRLSEGLRKSIERNAKDASPMVAPSALEWTLTTLDEDKEIENFAVGVPGLFDSHTIPDAKILSLMALKPETDAIFGYRLHDLLKTCLSGISLGTSPIDDAGRKSRLQVCLKCLWYFGRAYNKLQESELLPSYFPFTVFSPVIIQNIQTEPDPLSRVIGHCFGALIVTKLSADVRSRTNSNIPLEVSEDELACLSTFLNADRHDVTFCLECPGIVELASMVSLASGAVDSLRNDDGTLVALPLGQETLDILSGMAEPHLDQPNTQLNISDGIFDRIIVLPLLDLLQTCIMTSGTSGLAVDLRKGCLRVCLKSLWYFAKAYHQSGASKPLPSHFPLALSSPEIIRRIRVEEDTASRAMGCCFCALVITKLAADARSRPDSNVQIGDDELAYLSIILGTKSDDVTFCLERPGAIELASMVSLALGDLGSLDVSTLPPDVFDVAQQTLTILSQSLPAGLTAGLQLDRPLAQLNILNGEFDRAIMSCLLQILNACFMMSGPSPASPLPTEARRGCRRMCLMSLWHCAKNYHHLGPSTLLPSYFFDFATPEIINHIRTEKDTISYVIGRCFQSLIVSKGAAYIKLRTNSDAHLRNKVLTCLSAILDTGSNELRLWLEKPGAIELLNLILLAFDDISSFAVETVPSYILDVIPQTFSILSQAIPTEINTEVELYKIDPQEDILDGLTPTIGEIYRNHSIRCLKNLWHHLQSYSRPGNSVPLPPYVLFALASPTWTRCILTERGVASRVMARCIEALVIKDLVAGTKLSTTSANPNVQVRDDKLAWLSAIIGIESNDVKPCLECPGAVELTTMFSLVFGDVGPLDANALPSDVHDVVQKTLVILSRTTALQLHQPDPQLNTAFERVIVSGFRDLIRMCNPVASNLTATVRRSCLRMCLKSLWYCVKAYNQPWASKPMPSYFPIISSKDFIDFIEAQQDPISRVVGRCFSALVVMKLVADARYRTASELQLNDDEEDCLTAVLDIGGRVLDRDLHRVLDRVLDGVQDRVQDIVHQVQEDMRTVTSMLQTQEDRERRNLNRGHRVSERSLEEPGIVEIYNVILLALHDFNFLAADKVEVPSYVVQDVLPQTFSIISRALPAEINTELGLDHWINIQANVTLDGIEPSDIGELYRKHSIECLKNLWCRIRAYHQPGNSVPLPSYVLIAFAGGRWTRRMSETQDITIRVIGRCLEALVIKELVAGVNPSVQIPHDKLEWLSALLRTESNEVEDCIECPGIFELVAMVQIVSVGVDAGVDSLDINALPFDIRYVAKHTLASLVDGPHLHQPIAHLNILDENFDRIILSSLQNIYQMCLPGTSTLTAAACKSCRRMCLTNLCQWYCGKTYRQLDTSGPLPCYLLTTLANPEIQTELDPVSHVMGRFLCELVVMKLAADVGSRSGPNVQIGDDELASLSAFLGTDSDDVKLCLERPGAVELTSMVSLVLGDVIPFSFDLSYRHANERHMANRTLVILFQALSLALPAKKAGLQPMAWSDIFVNDPVAALISNFDDLLQICVSGTSLPTTSKVRISCLRMCLKTLWNCVKTYLRHGVRMVRPRMGSEPRFPSYLINTLYTPEFIHRIHTEEDPASRVTGCCFFALVPMLVLPGNIFSGLRRIDSTLGRGWFRYLSTVLGTKNDDLESCLECPGTVGLACMVSIVWGDVGSLDINALPSGVRDVAQETLAVLSRVVKLQLDQPISLLNSSDGEWERIIVSGLYNVLHKYISSTSQDPPLMDESEERTSRSCLRVSLDCLWYCAKAYRQLGASKPLPSYFISTLASPEIIYFIQREQDPVSCTTGRCFGALFVMKLAEDIRSRAGLDLQISDEELACISAILDVESPELKRWLSQKHAIELANILSLIFSEIDSLFSDTGPSEVLDKMQQTYSILSRTLPAELSAKLTNLTTDGSSESSESGTEIIHERQWRTCLENLWHCARTYNRSGIAVPLPSFVSITLTNPEFTRRIHSKGDLTTRVTGHCVQGLIVNKLADSISSSGGVCDVEMGWVSSLLQIEPAEYSRWRRPSPVLKLHNVVSLMSSEIETLFTLETSPADVLKIVQQTLEIISSDLTQGGAFNDGDLPMDQVLLLREICLKIANKRPVNQFTGEAADILERLQQISESLSAAEQQDAATPELSH